MKILLVNKFLYQKGGSETYVIKLGKKFEKEGHEVQYFGMANSKNTLKNDYNLYVKNKEFSNNNFFNKFNILSLIYNKEAYKKMLMLLKTYKPDLTILNNIEYHLTPSIIDAFKKYKDKVNNAAKLFYVTHDFQIVCPSHGLFDINISPCEKCLDGSYWNCFKTKCHKNSRVKSLIATLDSIYWHRKNTYKYVDKYICPSNFLKSKLDTDKLLKNKTIAIHNFIDKIKTKKYKKEDYIVYFGKLCKEKGTDTLIEVAKQLPDIKFVFVGYGPSEKKIKDIDNCEYLGFKSGDELIKIISKARFSICASECYENCPFSVIESQMYGTPVIGSNRGGIPELIDIGKTGEVFEAGNIDDLKKHINNLWNDKEKLNNYSNNCFEKKVITIDDYYLKIIDLYNEVNL